jgi:hypothetical protein
MPPRRAESLRLSVPVSYILLRLALGEKLETLAQFSDRSPTHDQIFNPDWRLTSRQVTLHKGSCIKRQLFMLV